MKITVIGIDVDPDGENLYPRDETMMRNFSAAHERLGLPGQKCYGLFGLFHVMQSTIGPDDFRPLAARLSGVGFKVASLVCFDIGSEVYFPAVADFPEFPGHTTRLFGMDGPLVLVKGIKDLKKSSRKNSITVFDLDKPGSPYRDSGKFMENKVNFFGGGFSSSDPAKHTTDFFRYVVFLRGAGPVTPLSGYGN